MGRHRTALPARVSGVRRRVDRWRERRAKRGPMPEDLWEAAISLARTHGIYPIARALRVDYGALKDRMQRSRRNSTRGGGDAGGFVEIDPTGFRSGFEPAGAVVELWAADGTKLVVRLSAREGPDLPGLIAVFSQRR